MNSKVYVVTGLDLGWDCVVGVFSSDVLTLEQLQERFPEGEYAISNNSVETDLENFD